MSNYVVEDEYDGYEETPTINNWNKKIIIIVAVVILVVFVLIVGRTVKKKSVYPSYENEMVEKAYEYVINNNIQSGKEIYLDVSKIGMNLPDNCSLLSGVIYNGIDYTPYLLCDKYESKIVDNSDRTYSLNGNDVVVLLKGMEYYELGYQGNGKMNISSDVKSTEGVYSVYYISTDSHVLTRKVIVIDNQSLYSYFPIINITDDNPIVVEKNTNFPSVTALDTIDGDITNNIVRYGDANLSTVGEYEVVYSVSNSLGYTSMIAKKIAVIDDINDYNNLQITISLDNVNMTNENVKAYVNIIGGNFDYMKLPNGGQVSSTNFEYEISENGEYEFVAISKTGEEVRKKITVSNIDKTIPVGTCKATLYNDKTKISVSVSSFNYIVGYNYNIDGKESGFIDKNNYTIDKMATTVSVKVKDYIGNETTIKCDTEQADPTLGNPNVKYFVYNNTEYVVPNTLNDLGVFEKAVCNRISQKNDLTNCDSACLSFASFYAAYLQRGDLSKMKMENACHYKYGGYASFKTLALPTKRDTLNYIFDEINRGKVMVMQVSSRGRGARHFVTAVGYRRSVHKREDLQEEDILEIDAINGCFDTISFADRSKRTLYDNKDGNGYRLDIITN